MNGFEKFAEKIITTDDLYLLLEGAREAEAASYEAGSDLLSNRLKGKVSALFEESLAKLEAAKNVPAPQEARVEYFRELKEYLQNLPKVKIELAFEPREEFVKKISDFINKDSKEKSVLDISIKPAILAGATIEHRGIFKDYSYPDKLRNVIKEKFAKIYNDLAGDTT